MYNLENIILAPGSVRLLQVSNLAFNVSDEILISWHKPDGGDTIDYYYIEWYEQDAYQRSGYIYVEHVSGQANYSSKITNLQYETKYKIWVVAKNSEGYGSYQSVDVITGSYFLVKYFFLTLNKDTCLDHKQINFF